MSTRALLVVPAGGIQPARTVCDVACGGAAGHDDTGLLPIVRHRGRVSSGSRGALQRHVGSIRLRARSRMGVGIFGA